MKIEEKEEQEERTSSSSSSVSNSGLHCIQPFYAQTMNELTARRKDQQKKMATTTDVRLPDLPHELVQEILYRVPVLCLIRCGCVSKLWYKSIHDPQFPSFHSRSYSQKNPRLMFNILNVPSNDQSFLSIFSYLDFKKDGVGDADGNGNGNGVYRGMSAILRKYKKVVVGYCDGLVCLTEMYPRPVSVEIFNLNMPQLFSILIPVIDGASISCYGFGFDSSLNREYKVVLIFDNPKDDQFKCLVFTLGTKPWAWRDNTNPSLPPRSLLNIHSKSAIFCSGALYWRTRETHEMVSFDLFGEKFRVLQIPAECVSTEQQWVRHVEFRGSFCIARIEKLLGSQKCNVHLHILKEQLWVKETIHLSFSPPWSDTTRIVSFCDQLLLYNYEGGFLELYNLHKEYFMEVKITSGHRDFDYELYSLEENFLSLKNFVPEGACKVNVDTLKSILEQRPRPPGGFLCLISGNQQRETLYYAF